MPGSSGTAPDSLPRRGDKKYKKITMDIALTNNPLLEYPGSNSRVPIGRACPRMGVGYAEVPSAYRTTLLGLALACPHLHQTMRRLSSLALACTKLCGVCPRMGINPRMGEWGNGDKPSNRGMGKWGKTRPGSLVNYD